MEDVISVSINGEDREILMSFGLLNALTKIIGDGSQIALVDLDPSVREEVLKQTLCERSPTGKVKQPIKELEDIDISVKDVEAVLDWVKAHVMSFFLRRTKNTMTIMNENKSNLDSLQSFLNGSQATAS